MRLWVWVCDLVMILVVGGDNGSCCSCGGANGWFYFYFCFRWWWQRLAVGVGLQRKWWVSKKGRDRRTKSIMFCKF